MKNIRLKIIITILACIMLNFNSYADNIIISPTVDSFYHLIKMQMDNTDRSVYEYSEFLNAVKNKKEYTTSNEKKALFTITNKNLIIGHSAVVYTAMYGRDVLRAGGYDAVGVGGSQDNQMLDWFRLLDKKYENIIIWGAANDIMSAIQNQTGCTNEYYNVLDTLLMEAENHLDKKNSKSKIVWVCVRDMEAGLDMPYEYCLLYNSMAHEINQHVMNKGIKALYIPQDTTSKNSAWYMHYTNPEVFQDILKMKNVAK